MASTRSLTALGRTVSRSSPISALGSARAIHGSSKRSKISEFNMPAMSPTMSSGSIARWSVKEGDKFSAGDVLLSIETDKAEVDVEAQEDGVMGKIVVGDDTKDIDVGRIIALLAEEGDDISNLEAPKEEGSESSKPKREDNDAASSKSSSSSDSPTKSASTPSSGSKTEPSQPQPKSSSHSHAQPKHDRPLLPSVVRVLLENDVEDASKIKGTGFKGMLTKGDVLAHLGKIKTPLGTYAKLAKGEGKTGGAEVKKGDKKSAPQQPLDAPALRRLIVSGLADPTPRVVAHHLPTSKPGQDFDDILAGYFSASSQNRTGKASGTPVPPPKAGSKDAWDDLIY